jgi:hypothetical protein
MKISIYLLLLLPFFSFSQFYQGEMIMKDQSIKKGLIDLPEDSTDKYVKFKVTEKSKAEKIEYDKIDNFSIIDTKKQKRKYTITYLAKLKPFNKSNEIKIDKRLSCVQVVKEGKINLYYAWFITAGYGALGTAVSQGNGLYFVNKPNENYSTLFYDSEPVNWFSYLKSNVEKIFAKDCPKFHEALDKKVIKDNGIIYFVDLYEQNCN